jgi:stage II sporulation protein M
MEGQDMQKTRFINLKVRKPIRYLKEVYPFVLMFLAFIIGIIIGALLLRFYPSVKTAVGREVLDDVKTDMDIGFWPSVWRCFFWWLPFLLLIFVFGLSIAGLAVVPVFVLFKGIHYGITAGYLYNVFSFNGIVYVLILIIPPTIIAAFGMFFSAEISFRFSLRLTRYCMPHPPEGYIYPRLIGYCKRFAFLLFVALAAALIYSLLLTAFADVIKIM